MSIEPRRYDPLGLAELDPALVAEADALAAQFDAPGHAGLPADRTARIAARHAFVGMKRLFLRAVENLEHRKGAWLRAQVRAAEDPVDLWLLRGPLLAALREDDREDTRKLRAELYRTLDTTFPAALRTARMSAQPAAAWR
ncbi:MAG TPA: hypothetical protein VF453_18720 [Burkholderiaceae bacterium]